MCKVGSVYFLVAWRKRWDIVCALIVSLTIWVIFIVNSDHINVTSDPGIFCELSSFVLFAASILCQLLHLGNALGFLNPSDSAILREELESRHS